MSDIVIEKTNPSLSTASRIYLYCVPLLIINTYFFYFIEGVISNTVMAKVKTITTFTSIFIILIVSFYVKTLLTWHVFSVFLFIEITILMLYAYVVYKHLNRQEKQYNSKSVKSISSTILRLGIPVSLGLAGQKLVYFLMTQRLANFNIDFISDLSVLMSITGIISLPFGAFSQIHSLFVSENDKKSHKQVFISGVKIAFSFITLMIFITWLVYPYLITLYGANPQLLDNAYFMSLACLFATSSLMLLCMSHLRALQDTFIPQSIAVILLLFGFTPIIWLHDFQGGELYKIIYTQSGFTFLISLILASRILQRRE